MIEIYCGDGKGKTTAATGLALRAYGNRIRVLFLQFMKNGSSGEIGALERLPGIEVHYPNPFYGFTRNMNHQQRAEMAMQYSRMLQMAVEAVEAAWQVNQTCQKKEEAHQTDELLLLVVLDEVIHACNKGLLSETELCRLLDKCPDNVEIVLTGREPSGELTKRADYISEIEKRKHPFDRGIPARKGIEK